ncbi:hypothetical protein M758_9G025500 [Ceratodon purpureus]|nr:hypothetical protein M758_9G025500 [Ceratodon purpureus]
MCLTHSHPFPPAFKLPSLPNSPPSTFHLVLLVDDYRKLTMRIDLDYRRLHQHRGVPQHHNIPESSPLGTSI